MHHNWKLRPTAVAILAVTSMSVFMRCFICAPKATSQVTGTNHTHAQTAGDAPGSSEIGGLFLCGWPNQQLAESLFPRHAKKFAIPYTGLDIQNPSGTIANPSDILVFGMYGPCRGANGEDIDPYSFPGKALFLNHEPRNVDMTLVKAGSTLHRLDQVYQLGLVPDSSHTIRVFQAAMVLMRFNATIRSTLFHHQLKPVNTGKYEGIVYTNRHCVGFREKAVTLLSTIVPVYYGSACKGVATADDRSRILPMPKRPTGSTAQWMGNPPFYRDYKFCISMENSKMMGYISEKIITAFLAGCIPIYYGTEEVFEIFNRHAFVYYNIEKPEPALAQIQYLSQNESAYQEMLHHQPILATGAETDFFSLSDEIGGGLLKFKIHTIMGLRN